MIAFTVPGQPQGKGRPIAGWRFAKGGTKLPSMRTPEKTVAYEGLIAHEAQAAMRGAAPLEVAVGCNVFVDCQVPASWSDKKRRMALSGELLPMAKPDVDNVVKAIFDGMNGVVWRDDVLAVDVRIRKRFAATPCVRVEVWPVEHPLDQAQLLEAVA